MEPNNFDKNIQQQFNSRKIEPSAQAWDRLDAMLTVAEEKQQPKKPNWLNLVASFLIFSGIGYFLLGQNEEINLKKPTNKVVHQEESFLNEVSAESNIADKEIKQLAAAIPKGKNTIIKKKKKIGDNTEAKSKFAAFLAVTEKQQEQITIIENKENNNQNLKHPEVSLPIKKNTYNYVDPETLLAEVQGEKKKNRTTNTNASTLKVSSKDLLHEVETELNQSFKDKALSQFKQAKTAIVNRNYN